MWAGAVMLPKLFAQSLAAALTLFAAAAFAAEAAPKAAAPAEKPAPAAKPEPTAPKLEPKALAILKAACDKLAAAKTMSFTAVIEEEGPDLNYGLPLEFSRTAQVSVRRPDKLFVKGHGSGPDTNFYYDGKTMVAWLPQENLAATAPAPATLDAMLSEAYDKGAIYFPFEDLIVTDPYKDLMDGLRVAFYIGQSDIVGGVKTDMIAFGNDGAFVQAWIGTEDKLPRRLRAVYLEDPAALRHDMVLSDWKLNVSLPAAIFVANVPADAGKIPFQRPAEMPPLAPPKSATAQPKADAPEAKAPAKEKGQ
jgi:hypothetical protein